MEESVSLSKVFGEIYFTAKKMPDNAFIYAQWFGVQSVETVKQGGYKLLDLVKEKKCAKLLNSNKHVVGSWDMALEWAQNEWAPAMRVNGLKYLAQVVPASIFATMTIETLIQKIEGVFEIRTFAEDADAESWLRSLGS